MWVIFALLDPDPGPDSEYGSGSGPTGPIEYGSNTDPAGSETLVQIIFEPFLVFRQMETELIDKLDILINENKGSFQFSSPPEEKH